ncbi:NUDIX hydrolase [Vibrio gallicus]|uniref:NUDIX hydrolase n=1 Tax=Vibrio gallicus TaxID=190897 RepID=UPI0021C4BCF5|nr:NUDIX hydrolase [Vibrio gallicus]
MRHLHTATHPDIVHLDKVCIVQRMATRAIALQGDKILLLYTERYEDYSLPGGGLEQDEDLIKGMVRELEEETGAVNIRNIKPFGVYEEFRPWHKDDADVMHMHSYCFTCDVDSELGEPNFEEYEIKNGMQAQWVPLVDAIAHNEKTMAQSAKQGLSIQRETFLLHLIQKELLPVA